MNSSDLAASSNNAAARETQGNSIAAGNEYVHMSFGNANRETENQTLTGSLTGTKTRNTLSGSDHKTKSVNDRDVGNGGISSADEPAAVKRKMTGQSIKRSVI